MATDETDETVDFDADAVGKVKSSHYRVAIVAQLKEHPKTPSEVSDASDHNIAHISRSLQEMSEMGLAECINPDNNKGRLYRLTGEGESVADKLAEWGQI